MIALDFESRFQRRSWSYVQDLADFLFGPIQLRSYSPSGDPKITARKRSDSLIAETKLGQPSAARMVTQHHCCHQ